jgi:hypothetical protein
MNPTTGLCDSPVAAEATRTVKEYLDTAIAESKKHTETLCIRKAKLETLGLLDMPHAELSVLLSSW